MLLEEKNKNQHVTGSYDSLVLEKYHALLLGYEWNIAQVRNLLNVPVIYEVWQNILQNS